MSRRRFREKAVSRWLAGSIDTARFLGLDEDDRLELLFLARSRFEKGEVGDAARLYEFALLQWPESADARVGLGACRQFAGAFEAAIACYEKAIALRPVDAYAGTNRAECLLLLGRIADAKEAIGAIPTSDLALGERIATLRRLAENPASSRDSMAK